VTVPTCPAPGAKVTVQVAVPTTLWLRAHWALDGLNVPVAGELWVKVTVPVGVTGLPLEVSVTVAVQVVAVPAASGFGRQETVVVVDLAHFMEAVPELVKWFVSP
jgi:hypothetical protein